MPRRRANANRRYCNLGMERLEDRALMAADIGVVLKNGWLSIQGTAGNDTILVEQVKNKITVEGTKRSFNASQVKGITINGLGGDDMLAVLGGLQDGVAIGSRKIAGLQPINAVTMINGGDGNDRIVGSSGKNLLDGGAGNDMLFGGMQNNVMFGGDGNDGLFGGEANDKLHGGAGDDSLCGYGGADLILGEDGADGVFGGTGDDVVDGGNGDDRLRGENGHDLLSGGGGDDLMEGGLGNDLIYGGSGNNSLNGNDGNDRIEGGSGRDVVYGEDGDDWIDAREGNDWVDAGAGSDVLLGGDGNDELYGRDGADTLQGNLGNDRLDGGGGNDLLRGGAGSDVLSGADGNDTLDGDSGYDELYGGDGDDQIYGLTLFWPYVGDYCEGNLGDDDYYTKHIEDRYSQLDILLLGLVAQQLSTSAAVYTTPTYKLPTAAAPAWLPSAINSGASLNDGLARFGIAVTAKELAASMPTGGSIVSEIFKSTMLSPKKNWDSVGRGIEASTRASAYGGQMISGDTAPIAAADQNDIWIH